DLDPGRADRRRLSHRTALLLLPKDRSRRGRRAIDLRGCGPPVRSEGRLPQMIRGAGARRALGSHFSRTRPVRGRPDASFAVGSYSSVNHNHPTVTKALGCKWELATRGSGSFRGERRPEMSADTFNATATPGVDPSRVRIAGAIKQAASTSGTNFEYLLTTAKMESDFNPAAGATTSSAHGLFQFIDQTWLGTVKEAGAQFGYGQYADAITKSSDGSYSVSDPATRR